MWNQVGPSPIQISEIKAYCDLSGITSTEVQKKYMRLIKLMDRVEISHHFKQRQKKAST